MIDREYVERLIDEGVKVLEGATQRIYAISVDKSINASVDIANGYAELAKVAASLIREGK
jgi:hypothetical protein